jgi:hypothetical protein
MPLFDSGYPGLNTQGQRMAGQMPQMPSWAYPTANQPAPYPTSPQGTPMMGMPPAPPPMPAAPMQPQAPMPPDPSLAAMPPTTNATGGLSAGMGGDVRGSVFNTLRQAGRGMPGPGNFFDSYMPQQPQAPDPLAAMQPPAPEPPRQMPQLPPSPQPPPFLGGDARKGMGGGEGGGMGYWQGAFPRLMQRMGAARVPKRQQPAGPMGY